MRCQRLRNPIVVFALTVSLVVPGPTLMAGEPASADLCAAAHKPVGDVELQRGGLLRGLVVDSHGIPRRGYEVALLHDGRPVTQLETDQHGFFQVLVAHGGIYHVCSKDGSASFRVWQPNTAPPHAAKQALVVQGTHTLRGQWSPAQALFAHPHFVLGIAALMVAVPILIHNNQSDRDQRPAS
jgi:hypothetical protein